LASGKRWKPPSRKRGARNEERKAYYKILLDKANDALLELNAQILEDNEKNKKYISNLQTYLEKMNGQ
jgi:1,2-phenylacetyl-CoA epoxidase catalytic subunit